jgi:hypothetical protein
MNKIQEQINTQNNLHANANHTYPVEPDSYNLTVSSLDFTGAPSSRNDDASSDTAIIMKKFEEYITKKQLIKQMTIDKVLTERSQDNQ